MTQAARRGERRAAVWAALKHAQKPMPCIITRYGRESIAAAAARERGELPPGEEKAP